MKVVLRHQSTGRYYRSPGEWVRRADNALAFDDVQAAREFSRANRLLETQPVHRLAPYLIPLLHDSKHTMWEEWLHGRGGSWYAEQASKFMRN